MPHVLTTCLDGKHQREASAETLSFGYVFRLPYRFCLGDFWQLRMKADQPQHLFDVFIRNRIAIPTGQKATWEMLGPWPSAIRSREAL